MGFDDVKGIPFPVFLWGLNNWLNDIAWRFTGVR